MKRKLIFIMVVALTTWGIRAALNPHITDLDLSIYGVADYDEFYEPSPSITPKGPGGFVCSNGWKMITLKAVGVNDPMKTRLNWNSARIEVWTATNGGTQVSSPTLWDPASSMPTQLWVKGVSASATGPTKDASGNWTNCGPETLCLEAINNGANPTTPGTYYDRVAFTVYQVVSIDVTPKNAPTGYVSSVGVSIGAGGFASAAHQADVEIKVLPAVANIPVDVCLVNGRGHEVGRDAKLEMGSLTATADVAAVKVATAAGGVISGVMTSSDVLSDGILNPKCTIHTIHVDSDVAFIWDTVSEEGEWTFSPDALPVPGVLTNFLTLRHHRDDTTNAPSEPFDNHDITFFVTQVQFSSNGVLTTLENTPAAPMDLSSWAHFSSMSYITTSNGLVEAPLIVEDNPALESIQITAYDWSVWLASAVPPPPAPVPIAPGSPINGGGVALASTKAAGAAAPNNPANRNIQSANAEHPTATIINQGSWIKPFFVRIPGQIPVTTNMPSLTGYYGANVRIYLGTNDVSDVSVKVVHSNTSHQVASAGDAWWHWTKGPVFPAQTVNYVDPLNVYFAGTQTLNRFVTYVAVPHTAGVFQLSLIVGTQTVDVVNITAVDARLYFPGPSAPVILTNNGIHTAIVPVGRSVDWSVTPPSLNMQWTQPPVTFSSASLSATNETEGMLCGIYSNNLTCTSFKVVANVSGSGYLWSKQLLPTDPAGPQIGRRGELVDPWYMICPDVKIAKPSGPLPANGEAGASADIATHPLYVFDHANPGQCKVTVETSRLLGLAPATRQLVWDRLIWRMPAVGNVTPLTNACAPVPNQPWATNFLYATMPNNNSAFGNTNVWLGFAQRVDWCWSTNVQFRFARTGTNAAARVIAAGTLSTNYVSAGNPNWYVYWQQVANGFSGSGSGPFSPQTTKMVYNSSNVGSDGQAGDYVPTAWSPSWMDLITMYDTNGCGIVACIHVMHHENGHHQSKELPPSQGGFGTGTGIVWSLSSDTDRDFINDLWETNAAVGYLLGFRITSPTNYAAVVANQVWRGNWDHGWTNATGYGSCTNPPASPYTNPGGYNLATGSGLCPRNEDHVTNQSTALKSNDWSFTGP
jgi:hypothetical protein